MRCGKRAEPCLTFLQHPPNIRPRPAIHPLERQLALLLVEHACLLRSVRQHEHGKQPSENGRYAFDEEQKLPICDRSMDVLNAECDQAPKRARDGREPEVVRKAQPDFLAGVEQR